MSDDIEVTTEMIEAGANALATLQSQIGLLRYSQAHQIDVAKAIFRAMYAARPAKPVKPAHPVKFEIDWSTFPAELAGNQREGG